MLKLKQAFNHLEPPICETSKVVNPQRLNPNGRKPRMSLREGQLSRYLKGYLYNINFSHLGHHLTKPAHEVAWVLSTLQ